jgi:hypothetical protein
MNRETEDDEVSALIVEVIRANPGIKARDIRDKVRAKRTRANHDALKRLVEKLISDRVIENRGSPGRHAYFLVE